MHVLSFSEFFDETGAVASSSTTTSDLHLIVGCAENKIVKNMCGDGLLLSLMVDETVHCLSPCDRRFNKTSAVASLSSSALEPKLVVGCGNFVFLYLVVGCWVLFCLLCAIIYVVCGPPEFLDWFVCFKFDTAQRCASNDNGDNNKIFVLLFDSAVVRTADARVDNVCGIGDLAISAIEIRCQEQHSCMQLNQTI